MPLMRICSCGGCEGHGPGRCDGLASVSGGGRRCESCAPAGQARAVHAPPPRSRRLRRQTRPQRRVYLSPRWREARERVLERDGWRCVDCGRGLAELGERERLLVDHVRNVLTVLLEGGDPYEPAGCETRCSTCSGRKDGRR